MTTGLEPEMRTVYRGGERYVQTFIRTASGKEMRIEYYREGRHVKDDSRVARYDAWLPTGGDVVDMQEELKPKMIPLDPSNCGSWVRGEVPRLSAPG